MINLKQKLKNNQLTIGSWLTIANPIIAEIMSQYFEWIVIDMEHSAITLDQCQDICRIISLNQKIPLVRLSNNDPIQIKRVMDAGATGVVIPNVNSRSDAELALKSVHYPPKGIRGVGLARAQNYGMAFSKYKKWLSKNVVVIAQIEHTKAVKNIHQILKTDIDGIIIGPYDISASLGSPGNFSTPQFKQCVHQILKNAIYFGKPAGIHLIPPYAKDFNKLDKRYRFFAFSLDTLIFSSKIRDELNEIKKRI